MSTRAALGRSHGPALGLGMLAALALAFGCNDGRVDLERMDQQAKFEPYDPSPFEMGGIMRHPPQGTVHRAQLLGPPELRDGVQNGEYVVEFPVAVSRERLVRGQNRFGIFCAPCHGVVGDGRSQVGENMRLRPPPSLHEPRIRAYPAGRLYAVIREGYGLMPAYEQELSVDDRWSVVAYVQALQLSQSVLVAELPPEVLEDAKPWLK